MSEKTIILDGFEVLIDDSACGERAETLVMIHGWPDTYRIWDAQVEFFRPHFRCVRFTLPGFDIRQPRQGHSLEQLTEQIRRLIEQVSPQAPVTLMLHDWGCVFGLQTLLRHPQLVRRVVAIDVGDASSPAFLQSLSGKAKLMIAGYQLSLVAAWRLGGGLGDRITRAMARALKCPAEPQHIGAAMNYPYDMQWTGSFGGFKGKMRPLHLPCPLFFAYGRKKPFMFHSQAWLEGLQAQAQHRVQGFDCGHWVMREQAQAFNAAALGWLQA
ncbi:pimeloyl-ACP methyl ester carboxylesterase [Paucibacter oligotrophus]|uniref:Pimeloyl-ACP methyl ester carboxylesterase n=1 Tax=Roseateles oligotrophus TaxID=1769250 RepID=A0A840LD76_9BURK|nr:alpha/beta hydrolase [Roseateles oligotrophus]MBB4844633.1 pimeloyl-ACP methyl ester carboxylesterase [Roseateles oligotrophus]